MNLENLLLKKGEITMLVGDPKVGSSIAAVQAGMRAADTQKVLYIDLETEDSAWKHRYSHERTLEMYDFGENFIRFAPQIEFMDYKTFCPQVLAAVTKVCTEVRPDVIILDNINFLSSHSMDPSIAINVVKEFKAFCKEYSTSVLILIHSPKQYGNRYPICDYILSGYKILSNFANQIWGIARTNDYNKDVYLKHIKAPYAEHFKEVTFMYTIQKHDGFVGMHYVDSKLEYEHFKKLESPKRLRTGTRSEAIEQIEKIKALFDDENCGSSKDIVEAISNMLDITPTFWR